MLNHGTLFCIVIVGVRGCPERDIPSLGAMDWCPMAGKILLGTSPQPPLRAGPGPGPDVFFVFLRAGFVYAKARHPSLRPRLHLAYKGATLHRSLLWAGFVQASKRGKTYSEGDIGLEVKGHM